MPQQRPSIAKLVFFIFKEKIDLKNVISDQGYEYMCRSVGDPLRNMCEGKSVRK